MTGRVPFLDLAAQTASLQPALGEAVARVLASGQYVLGENVAAFEREIAAFCGAKYAVGLASGTDALVLALQALDIGPGDEVITTPFTFVATAEAIHRVGAQVVFADIEPTSFNIDPRQIARRITRRTRAILPVHLFGQPAAMAEILALAKKHKLAVVEDAAQAIGATFRGRSAGTLGAAGILSFYPTKNLGAAGDAGALLTDSRRIAETVRMLRAHGARRRYFHERHGMNSRLDELQAAILRVKLRRLSDWNARRRAVARWYRRELSALGNTVVLPTETNEGEHIYHVFSIRVAARLRDALARHLAAQAIGAAVFYPLPLHVQKAFQELGYRRGDFPVAERAAREVLALPIFPEMNEAQVKTVAKAIRVFFGRAA